MGMRGGGGGGGGGGWGGYIRATDEKPKVTGALLKRVLSYSLPYRWHLVGMLCAILVTTGLHLLMPQIMRDLIDNTIPQKNVPRLIMLSVTLLFIPAVTGAANVLQRRLNSRVGEGVIYDLRTNLFSRLQRMSLRFFTNTKTGELMSRLNNDVVGSQNAISSTIVGIVTNLVQGTAVLVVMLTMEWRLTLISVCILPLFIIVARSLGDRLRVLARQQMDANAQMNAMVNETLNVSGALLVKLFGRTSTEVERYASRAAAVREMGIKRTVTSSVFMVIISLVSAVGTALIYGIGGYLAIRDVFTVGAIVAFGSYLGSLYSALQNLANAPVEFATSVVSFERVFEVMDLPLDIEDKPDALVLEDIRGNILFENVSFRYEVAEDGLLSEVKRQGDISSVGALSGVTAAAASTADKDDASKAKSQARESALEDINFQVRAGQLVALVGPSGAGKTTLTYLIPRLYDPSEGLIRLDGHDLRDVNSESLAQQIGMVTQETYLFHDTIRTNLVYARLDARQEEIEEATQAANIHDFIMGLPNGYDTIVGERGYRLSGGEKQRLALARVILKDPRVLVLDEATSSLDSESEALIQEALKRVMAGRTSIVIAHRLSTILAADMILVMDRGRIVERGTHPELLELDGLYASLYNTQFNRDYDED